MLNMRIMALALLASVQLASGGDTKSPAAHEDIMKAFCRSDFDAADRGIDAALKGIGGSGGKEAVDANTYRLLRLRARVAGARRWRFYMACRRKGGTSRGKNAEQLGRLATECTAAYEAAFRQAPTRYEKARLTAQWWDLIIKPKFDADSMLLRSATLNRLVAEQPETLPAQRACFEARFLKLLDAADRTKAWPEKRKTVFAELVGVEFAKLQAVGMPKAVADGILDSLPTFVREYMPIVDSGDGEQFRITMRWYLWIAVMQRLPCEIERKHIDTDVEASAKEIEKTIDTIITHPRLLPVGVTYAKQFRESYAALKTNRFVSSFKRVRLEHERKKTATLLTEQLRQLSASWREDMAALDALPAGRAPLGRYIAKQAEHARTVSDVLILAHTLYDRPAMRQCFTDELIMLSRATVNKKGYCVFRVRRVIPYKQLPSVGPGTGKSTKRREEFRGVRGVPGVPRVPGTPYVILGSGVCLREFRGHRT